MMAVFTVRAAWPTTICPEGDGLHVWSEGIAALSCDWCGQHILYGDCASYQSWTIYWRSRLLGSIAVLN